MTIERLPRRKLGHAHLHTARPVSSPAPWNAGSSLNMTRMSLKFFFSSSFLLPHRSCCCFSIILSRLRKCERRPSLGFGYIVVVGLGGGKGNKILQKKKKIGHVFIFQSIKDVHQSAPRATTSFPPRTFRRPKGTLTHALHTRGVPP